MWPLLSWITFLIKSIFVYKKRLCTTETTLLIVSKRGEVGAQEASICWGGAKVVKALEKDWALDEVFSIEQDLPTWFQAMDLQLGKMEKAYSFFAKEELAAALILCGEVGLWMREGFAFITALMVHDPHFTQLGMLQNSILHLEQRYETLVRKCGLYLGRMSEKEFQELLNEPPLEGVGGFLHKGRGRALGRLRADQEEVVWDLAEHCYFPLTKLYHQLDFSMRLLSYEEDQVWTLEEARKIWKGDDRALAAQVFEAAQRTWKGHAPLFAQLLSQVVAFRKTLSTLRNWKGPIEESFSQHQVEEAFFRGFEEGVQEMKAPLIVFLKFKSQLMGKKRLGWQDLQGLLAQEHRTPLNWDEGWKWLHAGLSRAHGGIGEFFKRLDRQGWIMTSQELMQPPNVPSFQVVFPLKKQHRLYLSLGECVEELLDHTRLFAAAWRQELLFEQEPLNQGANMLLQEALASYCERSMLEVIKERSHTRQQYFDALYQHLDRHVLACLQAQALTSFERQLYGDLQEKGSLDPEELHKKMEKAQKEAFANQLSQYNPYEWINEVKIFDHFWASSHWIPSAGQLMGLGLYQSYLKEPRGFSEKLERVIQEVGRYEPLREVFKKNLGVDLHAKQFWTGALRLIDLDLQELAKIAKVKDKTFEIESKSVL